MQGLDGLALVAQLEFDVSDVIQHGRLQRVISQFAVDHKRLRVGVKGLLLVSRHVVRSAGDAQCGCLHGAVAREARACVSAWSMYSIVFRGWPSRK